MFTKSQRQCAVPFDFEEVHPLDVEDWVKINTSTNCDGYFDQFENFCPVSDPLDGDNTHLQRILVADDQERSRRKQSLPATREQRSQVNLPRHSFRNDAPSASVDNSSNEPASLKDGPEAAEEDTISAVSDSSSHVPDDLNDFFDCAREVNLRIEQISELRFDMSERQGASELPQPGVEDDETKFKALEAALVIARQRASEQRAICLAQGIDPDVYRYRRLSRTSE